MADDEFEYLQPGFEPTTLTVPRLRSILVAHNVPYPSSAKKPDLVALFHQHVAPQARNLLSAQSRTKRSARGIEDVASSQGSTVEDDNDDYMYDAAPAATPARRSTRRSTRLASEDIVEPTPRTSRRTVAKTPTTAKRASSKHARIEEDGEHAVEEHGAKRHSSARTRYSEPPPHLPIPIPVSAPKAESEYGYSAAEPVYHEGPESPFSRENPFQSGSSPPSGYRSKSGERRRTTMGASADRERRKTRETRRRTDGLASIKQDDGIVVPSKATFEMPDDFQAGEEFTPEEQQDLVKLEQKGDTALVRRPRKKQRKSGFAKAAPWTVLLAMLGGVATVWRQEKLNVGYCGVGEPSNTLGGVEIPEWASFIQPQCEPCPQHAYCYSDLKTVCEPDFVLTPHPLSAAGLIPLPPTCEPDSEKVRRVKAVADFAVESELRTRNAQYECGEIASPEISEPELKKTVSAKRSRRMTDEEFEELWGSAMGEIVGREEVESRVEGQDSVVRFLQSTSLAKVSLTCAIRRSLRLTIRQNLPRLVGLIAISLSAVYGRYALTTRRSTKHKAKQLAALALDKLATQASLHAEDPVVYPEPWISMVALRDDVLREEFRAKERTRLWEVVKGLVEGNANVRTMVREGRTGDVSRVWEWIGAVQRIEGSARRQSGSVRKLVGSPGRMGEIKAEEDDGNESSLVNRSRWEEGTPYY